MTNKDTYKIFILLAVLLGGFVRFLPVFMAGFPVNDGGMFYVMVEELKANHFLLPDFTSYNLAGIPYAYSPFGFYVTAAISSLFRTPALEIVRWLPALASTFSLLAFYLLAQEILGSPLQAALATVFYGLVPDSFGWAIMGGGVTRAFGLLFLFLTVAFANRLFARTSGLHAVLTALFGSLAFLSHPQTGLQAAAACILLWLFRGRTRQSLLWSVAVAIGVVALTAPWWGMVLAKHGFSPFQSALQTSDDGAFHLAKLLTLQIGGGVFFNLTVALGFIGLLGVLARRNFLLPVWLLYPFFLDPRSAGGMALLPLSMLAAYGFDSLLAPALLSVRKREGAWLEDRFVTFSLFGIAFYLFFSAAIFGLSLSQMSLPAADRETFAWVRANLPPQSNFLLLTGEQYSMKDPFQEWFPALTEQHSHTTLQGAEWTLGANFFPFYGELVALQHCADITCIEDWGERTALDHQYLLIRILPAGSASPLKATLGLLLSSIRDSGQYQIVHETGNAVIFSRR